MAQILQFPRKEHPAPPIMFRVAQNLWAGLRNNTPSAKEQMDRLVADIDQCTQAIKGDGDAV